MNNDLKQAAIDWVEARKNWLSRTHMDIWHFHEPAWREYRSADYYVELLLSSVPEMDPDWLDNLLAKRAAAAS